MKLQPEWDRAKADRPALDGLLGESWLEPGLLDGSTWLTRTNAHDSKVK